MPLKTSMQLVSRKSSPVLWINKHQAVQMSYRQNGPGSRMRRYSYQLETEDETFDANDRDMVTATMRRYRRENPLLAGILNRIVDNVCGPGGPVLQIQHEDTGEGDKIEKDWKIHSRYIDAREQMDFREIIRTCLSEKILVGDAGIIHVGAGRFFGVEEDQIRTPATFSEISDKIKSGVQYDVIGKAVRYYVTDRANPTDYQDYSPEDFKLYGDFDRFSQLRCVSPLLPCIEHLEDLDQYLEAEKAAAIFNSSIVFKSKSAYSSATGTMLGDIVNTAEYNQTDADGNRVTIPKFRPSTAMNIELGPEEDFDVIKDERPGGQFANYIEMICRLIGVGINLPLELVLLNFKDASWSSIRAILLECRRSFLAHRRSLAKLCGWMFVRWYKANQYRYKIPVNELEWEWQWDGWHLINPKEELEAAAQAIDMGISNLKIECAMLGRDEQKILAQRVKELAARKDKVPIPVGSPGQTILNLPVTADSGSSASKINNKKP